LTNFLQPTFHVRDFTLSFHRVLMGLIASLLLIPFGLQAEENAPQTGPVIENYGPVFNVPNAWGFTPGVTYRAVLDVSSSPESHADLNRAIESAARLINMSVRDGGKAADLQVALVLHGSAAKDTLDNEAYQSRFDTPNPNDGLITALKEAGVEIYLCGQSAAYNGYQVGELHPGITMATSAMTVLTRLQAEGWSLLP